jgi:hypothetical protein
MEISRPVQAVGGFAAIGIAVLLMLPPTKPVTAAPAPHAFGKVEPPAPLEAVYPDLAPLPPAPPVDPAADTIGGGPGSAPQAAQYAPRAAYAPESDTYGSESIRTSADADADFDRGYRWAERRDLEDPNLCMRWADQPHVEGCIAYIRDRAGRDDGADPDDRYASDEER